MWYQSEGLTGYSSWILSNDYPVGQQSDLISQQLRHFMHSSLHNSFVLWGEFSRAPLFLFVGLFNLYFCDCWRSCSNSNTSHPLQYEDLREILIWSETHFSAWLAQTALFPTLAFPLCVIWEERVVICHQEARSGLHTVGVACPLLQWRRL